MEPGGKGVLYEICESRSPRRGAGDRRKRTGIKEKKETTKEKVKGLIRSIPDTPFSERKSQISTPIVTYRKAKQ